MANSDFNVVRINQTFTVNNPTVTKGFPIEGTKQPVDDAFLLIQIKGVGVDTHRIYINDKELPSLDLPAAPGGSQAYQLWMDHIPPEYLKLGDNRLRIDRVGNDDFYVANVVVHWRE